MRDIKIEMTKDSATKHKEIVISKKKTMKVLIVNDSPIESKLLCKILERFYHFQVDIANNSTEFLEKIGLKTTFHANFQPKFEISLNNEIKTNNYDFVIIDNLLRKYNDMDGIEN